MVSCKHKINLNKDKAKKTVKLHFICIDKIGKRKTVFRDTNSLFADKMLYTDVGYFHFQDNTEWIFNRQFFIVG